jgi:hypothetical protein
MAGFEVTTEASGGCAVGKGSGFGGSGPMDWLGVSLPDPCPVVDALHTRFIWNQLCKLTLQLAPKRCAE